MIHALFEDGEKMLFDPDEVVDVCTWISENGEYFDGPQVGSARSMIKPGVYVLERNSYEEAVCSNTTQVVSVYEIDD